jgi:hypothetical protein
MLSQKTVQAKILDILGVSTPFPQGGCVRLTIPKRMVKKFNLEQTNEKAYFGFVFVETDKGILLVALDKAVNTNTIQNTLGFLGLSKITKEDLEELFSEKE